ncbi:antifreeze protein [Mycobacterium sp. 852002-51163_SCH5372311]|uniref:SPFH domain-containing protein n=1 Tax=Mycobacterium sp. 852002-51163_SCH5372311 TaxID=1834097 RepID=UPI0007FDF180|nr:SPFH domain-containing protein [Mycobacterium sp. 852002-51163_SCH5372311]OBF86377.1 antifreeze protein [Mycobacterium sp. 852002-51163_SCH5372311]
MGMRDMMRGEFVDIIEWLDDTNTTLAWRFPRYQNEIKNGAQLVVREGQRAMFVYRGQLADQFNPGHYTLTSENMPILGTLQGWKYGFNSPFRSEVYYVNTRPYPDLRWGTPQPVTVRDPDFKMVQVRANGTTVVRVTDPTVFLRQVLGTQSVVDMDQITEMIRRNIALAFNDMVMGSGLGAIDLQGRQVELSDKLREFVAQRVQAFGLGIDAVTMTISLPEEIQQAMTRGVARGLEESGFLNNVGDLDRFAKARQADAMLAAAQNEGGGAAGSAIQAGLGVALGSQMANAAQGGYAQPQQPQHFAPQGAPPPLPPQQQFHFEREGQPAGPYPIEGLRQFVASGQLTRDTVVWTEGMANWAPASTVPSLQSLFSTPPPLPGTPPPLPQQ